ncbi:MAG: ABC transporter ATP-binding protein [Candidatus Cloacimonadales bacterium]|jgi:putative ABC transport system ATP-binding protein|nr:ABC transporter ATP-binding protein [Candidatus Cloacimonadales bacterium]HPY95657.1 ABC transporter ATP-binding protein [Candidatus Cloacimonadota bacterium]HQB40329.1 ABC transporter ATP-binding protein [Candidatus Cloacimonadota bacterium]
MDYVIKTEEIKKVYNMGAVDVHALRSANVTIAPGEFVSIMGPSGSGKSTLMHILGCLDSPSDGKYFLDGEEVSSFSKNKLAWIRNIKIGFVFQTFNLLPHLNILKNVELPLMYAGRRASLRNEIATDLLTRLGLGDRLHHKPSELSGGQRQRVAIARAVVNNPAIILADEPTGNLDSQSGNDILSIFKELHQEKNTIIMVTHDKNIAKIADRIIMIKDGEVVDGDITN